MKINTIDPRTVLRNYADSTFCPIPVRHHALVLALLNEYIFEVLNILPVPGKELSGKVDLFLVLKTVKARTKQNRPSC